MEATQSRNKSNRGKKRVQPGYHASRGWFYKPIQKVIRKWDAVFGRDFTHDTWLGLRRIRENGNGILNISICNQQHWRFVCELMAALDKLFDLENSSGWVVKVWPRWSAKAKGPELMPYAEMPALIKELGGPNFTVDQLKQAASRLKLIVTDSKRREKIEQSWMHAN